MISEPAAPESLLIVVKLSILDILTGNQTINTSVGLENLELGLFGAMGDYDLEKSPLSISENLFPK